MKNSNQLVAGYENVGSIVRRNTDGKEFVVSEYDAHVYKMTSANETVEIHANTVEILFYEVVAVREVNQTILKAIKLIDSRLSSMRREAMRLFKQTNPSFNTQMDEMDKRQETLYESIKHSLGFYLESLERYELLDQLFMNTLKTGLVAKESTSVIIEDLDFCTRTYNCLKRHGVHTVNDLIAMSLEEIKKVRNLSLRGIEEIEGTINHKFI